MGKSGHRGANHRFLTENFSCRNGFFRRKRPLVFSLISFFILSFGFLLSRTLNAAKNELSLEKVDPRAFYIEQILKGIPVTMKSFIEETGRFASGGWGIDMQEVIYPLAYMYSLKDKANPFSGDSQLLDAALKGGDAIYDSQYADGSVEMVKSDGTSWGRTYLHATLTSWLETFVLLKDKMDEERKKRWEQGIQKMVEGIYLQILGNRNKRLYSGIFRDEEVNWAWGNFEVNSLSTWDGLNLFRAGQIFERKEWQQTGQRMIHSALETLDPLGYWPEFGGPSPSQNVEYLQAITLYYEYSGDLVVVPYLERGVEFQTKFVYPDGTLVETLDGRSRYNPAVLSNGHFAFSQFPQGRRLAKFLVLQMLKRRTALPLTSNLLRNYRYYHDGEEEKLALEKRSYSMRAGNKAVVQRKGPWFYCVSGFTATPIKNRWALDRQNFISVWHEQLGLIIGGGNSKAQAEWSNFIFPRAGRLAHIPTNGEVREDNPKDTVILTYEDKRASIEISPENKKGMRIKTQLLDPESSTTGQLLLYLKAGNTCKTASGGVFSLNDKSVEIRAEEAGPWVEFEGWRITLPVGSRITFPSFPFDPYDRQGKSTLAQARGILSYPLNSSLPSATFTITILKP